VKAKVIPGFDFMKAFYLQEIQWAIAKLKGSDVQQVYTMQML
jgi:hypothetical protein